MLLLYPRRKRTSLLCILGRPSYTNLYSTCCRIPSTELTVGGDGSQLDLRSRGLAMYNEPQLVLGARILSTYEAVRVISSSAKK